MTGRYIALAADDPDDHILHISTGIDVFSDKLIYNDSSVCNIDLGMTDGGILDMQISASSFQRMFPPSHSRPFYNGWCSDLNDANPFIQVDLLVETKVEGISVWNWQKTITTMNEVIWDTVVHFGVDVLNVSFGKTEKDLRLYKQVGQ
ncbi:coagulation factor VIII-like [Ruditapes philippinarum]|uniref:coagulation factor VIII-like n=1 Tax=Ruditapes philippinarum TaxID=129788 RepID=UPI00295B0607|nr:coagulation factor VIII-like [Ruditapes philippinarum]